MRLSSSRPEIKLTSRWTRAEAQTYDTRLVGMLRQGKTIDSYRILISLGIDPGDSDAVKMVKNQLEELRRFNLVKETPAGWRWIS